MVRRRNPRSCVPGSAGRADRSARSGASSTSVGAIRPDWRKPASGPLLRRRAGPVQPGGCSARPGRAGNSRSRAAGNRRVPPVAPQSRGNRRHGSIRSSRPVPAGGRSCGFRLRRRPGAPDRARAASSAAWFRNTSAAAAARPAGHRVPNLCGRRECFEIDDLFAERTDCLQDAVLALPVAPQSTR